MKLYAAEAEANKTAKEAQASLDLATLKQYGKLTEDEVKTLVLDDKWQATVTSRAAEVVDSLAQALVARIQQLGDRYAVTLTALETDTAKMAAEVAGHLAAMGLS